MENANGGGRSGRSVRRNTGQVFDGNRISSEVKASPLPKLIFIVWLDACHEFGWQEGNEDIDSEIVPCVTVGWLLSKTKQSVKVCQTWSPDNHAQTIVIPMGMIQKIEEIKLSPEELIGTKSKR